MKNLIIKSMPAIVFLVVFVVLMKLLPPIRCNDGTSSSSIGKQGACSHHGGVSSWQPTVAFLVSSAATAWYLNFIKNKIHSNSETERTAPPVTEPKPQRRKRRTLTKCPKCKSSMVLRTAQQGRNTGGKFWGCSRYPLCKGTRRYESSNEA